MAFNFNWSPLIADTSRAREMLTAALNKSPKPALIVDDIVVTELNLGQIPPQLDVLEIGDLAEDRFRGIFKLSYAGDAFLTLRTRVQANPLNTFLSTKPSFASPAPLAAGSGLTIPLQLTLSEIRLSGFVILVFSRQKGITLVFRNDPLDSLKVSSTFDSIPFVRDYLQSEIEKQLRTLFLEDLPAILHRLSLRMVSSEYQEPSEQDNTHTAGFGSEALEEKTDTTPINPLFLPPRETTSARDYAFLGKSQLTNPDPQTLASLRSYSLKNLLRLSRLSSSHDTLSLSTHSIPDTIFRATSSSSVLGLPYNHSLSTSQPPLTLSSLSRLASNRPSSVGKSSLPGSDQASSHEAQREMQSPHSEGFGDGIVRRPSLNSYYTGSTSSLLSSRSQSKKRKHRVFNLRRKESQSAESDATEQQGAFKVAESAPQSAASLSETVSTTSGDLHLASDPGEARPPTWEYQGEVQDHSPRASSSRGGQVLDAASISRSRKLSTSKVAGASSSRLDQHAAAAPTSLTPIKENPNTERPEKPKRPTSMLSRGHRSSSSQSLFSNNYFQQTHYNNAQVPQLTGSILEQAWMVKIAAEMAQRIADERGKGNMASTQSFWDRVGDGARFDSVGTAAINMAREDVEAPPAYVE